MHLIQMHVEMPEHLNANAASANYSNACKHKTGMCSTSVNNITVSVCDISQGMLPWGIKSTIQPWTVLLTAKTTC